MSLATMQFLVFLASIAAAVACFVIYARLTVNPPAQEQIKQAITDSTTGAKGLEKVTAADIAELLKSLASLVDSLLKAGPALWSLIGSILFLLIAAIASGLIVGKPEPAATKSPTETRPNGNNTTNTTANASGSASSNAIANDTAPAKPAK